MRNGAVRHAVRDSTGRITEVLDIQLLLLVGLALLMLPLVHVPRAKIPGVQSLGLVLIDVATARVPTRYSPMLGVLADVPRAAAPGGSLERPGWREITICAGPCRGRDARDLLLCSLKEIQGLINVISAAVDTGRMSKIVQNYQ